MIGKDSDRRRLIYDLFHALNQPLAGLHCSLEVTLQQPRTAEQYRETLSQALELVEKVAWAASRIRELFEAGDA